MPNARSEERVALADTSAQTGYLRHLFRRLAICGTEARARPTVSTKPLFGGRPAPATARAPTCTDS